MPVPAPFYRPPSTFRRTDSNCKTIYLFLLTVFILLGWWSFYNSYLHGGINTLRDDTVSKEYYQNHFNPITARGGSKKMNNNLNKSGPGTGAGPAGSVPTMNSSQIDYTTNTSFFTFFSTFTILLHIFCAALLAYWICHGILYLILSEPEFCIGVGLDWGWSFMLVAAASFQMQTTGHRGDSLSPWLFSLNQRHALVAYFLAICGLSVAIFTHYYYRRMMKLSCVLLRCAGVVLLREKVKGVDHENVAMVNAITSQKNPLVMNPQSLGQGQRNSQNSGQQTNNNADSDTKLDNITTALATSQTQLQNAPTVPTMHYSLYRSFKYIALIAAAFNSLSLIGFKIAWVGISFKFGNGYRTNILGLGPGDDLGPLYQPTSKTGKFWRFLTHPCDPCCNNRKKLYKDLDESESELDNGKYGLSGIWSNDQFLNRNRPNCKYCACFGGYMPDSDGVNPNSDLNDLNQAGMYQGSSVQQTSTEHRISPTYINDSSNSNSGTQSGGMGKGKSSGGKGNSKGVLSPKKSADSDSYSFLETENSIETGLENDYHDMNQVVGQVKRESLNDIKFYELHGNINAHFENSDSVAGVEHDLNHNIGLVHKEIQIDDHDSDSSTLSSSFLDVSKFQLVDHYSVGRVVQHQGHDKTSDQSAAPPAPTPPADSPAPPADGQSAPAPPPADGSQPPAPAPPADASQPPAPTPPADAPTPTPPTDGSGEPPAPAPPPTDAAQSPPPPADGTTPPPPPPADGTTPPPADATAPTPDAASPPAPAPAAADGSTTPPPTPPPPPAAAADATSPAPPPAASPSPAPPSNESQQEREARLAKTLENVDKLVSAVKEKGSDGKSLTGGTKTGTNYDSSEVKKAVDQAAEKSNEIQQKQQELDEEKQKLEQTKKEQQQTDAQLKELQDQKIAQDKQDILDQKKKLEEQLKTTEELQNKEIEKLNEEKQKVKDDEMKQKQKVDEVTKQKDSLMQSPSGRIEGDVMDTLSSPKTAANVASSTSTQTDSNIDYAAIKRRIKEQNRLKREKLKQRSNSGLNTDSYAKIRMSPSDLHIQIPILILFFWVFGSLSNLTLTTYCKLVGYYLVAESEQRKGERQRAKRERKSFKQVEQTWANPGPGDQVRRPNYLDKGTSSRGSRKSQNMNRSSKNLILNQQEERLSNSQSQLRGQGSSRKNANSRNLNTNLERINENEDPGPNNNTNVNQSGRPGPPAATNMIKTSAPSVWQSTKSGSSSNPGPTTAAASGSGHENNRASRTSTNNKQHTRASGELQDFKGAYIEDEKSPQPGSKKDVVKEGQHKSMDYSEPSSDQYDYNIAIEGEHFMMDSNTNGNRQSRFQSSQQNQNRSQSPGAAAESLLGLTPGFQTNSQLVRASQNLVQSQARQSQLTRESQNQNRRQQNQQLSRSGSSLINQPNLKFKEDLQQPQNQNINDNRRLSIGSSVTVDTTSDVITSTDGTLYPGPYQCFSQCLDYHFGSIVMQAILWPFLLGISYVGSDLLGGNLSRNNNSNSTAANHNSDGQNQQQVSGNSNTQTPIDVNSNTQNETTQLLNNYQQNTNVNYYNDTNSSRQPGFLARCGNVVLSFLGRRYARLAPFASRLVLVRVGLNNESFSESLDGTAETTDIHLSKTLSTGESQQWRQWQQTNNESGPVTTIKCPTTAQTRLSTVASGGLVSWLLRVVYCNIMMILSVLSLTSGMMVHFLMGKLMGKQGYDQYFGREDVPQTGIGSDPIPNSVALINKINSQALTASTSSSKPNLYNSQSQYSSDADADSSYSSLAFSLLQIAGTVTSLSSDPSQTAASGFSQTTSSSPSIGSSPGLYSSYTTSSGQTQPASDILNVDNMPDPSLDSNPNSISQDPQSDPLNSSDSIYQPSDIGLKALGIPIKPVPWDLLLGWAISLVVMHSIISSFLWNVIEGSCMTILLSMASQEEENRNKLLHSNYALVKKQASPNKNLDEREHRHCGAANEILHEQMKMAEQYGIHNTGNNISNSDNLQTNTNQNESNINNLESDYNDGIAIFFDDSEALEKKHNLNSDFAVDRAFLELETEVRIWKGVYSRRVAMSYGYGMGVHNWYGDKDYGYIQDAKDEEENEWKDYYNEYGYYDDNDYYDNQYYDSNWPEAAAGDNGTEQQYTESEMYNYYQDESGNFFGYTAEEWTKWQEEQKKLEEGLGDLPVVTQMGPNSVTDQDVESDGPGGVGGGVAVGSGGASTTGNVLAKN